jgi:hypothetical protein
LLQTVRKILTQLPKRFIDKFLKLQRANPLSPIATASIFLSGEPRPAGSGVIIHVVQLTELPEHSQDILPVGRGQFLIQRILVYGESE